MLDIDKTSVRMTRVRITIGKSFFTVIEICIYRRWIIESDEIWGGLSEIESIELISEIITMSSAPENKAIAKTVEYSTTPSSNNTPTVITKKILIPIPILLSIWRTNIFQFCTEKFVPSEGIDSRGTSLLCCGSH